MGKCHLAQNNESPKVEKIKAGVVAAAVVSLNNYQHWLTVVSNNTHSSVVRNSNYFTIRQNKGNWLEKLNLEDKLRKFILLRGRMKWLLVLSAYTSTQIFCNWIFPHRPWGLGRPYWMPCWELLKDPFNILASRRWTVNTVLPYQNMYSSFKYF